MLPHTVFMYFVWISEQTTIISLYYIDQLVCITEAECVHCAVRTECLNLIWVKLNEQAVFNLNPCKMSGGESTFLFPS